MELRSLQTFIQVAETGSFTRAAARMGYSQPTVSFQIRQLEKELNAQLFDRVGHTVRLTDRGRELLPQAQRICQLCQEIETAEQTEPSGLVRIGMADSLCSVLVSSSFADFRAAHPNIAVSVIDAHGHNMNAHQSLRSMKEGNPAFFEKLDQYSRKYVLPQG